MLGTSTTPLQQQQQQQQAWAQPVKARVQAGHGACSVACMVHVDVQHWLRPASHGHDELVDGFSVAHGVGWWQAVSCWVFLER